MKPSDTVNDTSSSLLWLRRVQWRYPKETRAMDEAQILEMIKEALSTCLRLEIIDEKDILRYVALRVLLTPEQKQSSLIAGVLLRILSNLDWDSKKRLDFVYKHVVGRPVSKKETDFSKFFPAKIENS